jgi:hypothetical protein
LGELVKRSLLYHLESNPKSLVTNSRFSGAGAASNVEGAPSELAERIDWEGKRKYAPRSFSFSFNLVNYPMNQDHHRFHQILHLSISQFIKNLVPLRIRFEQSINRTPSSKARAVLLLAFSSFLTPASTRYILFSIQYAVSNYCVSLLHPTWN